MLGDDLPRRTRQDHHPVGEIGGLVDVVRDEEHGLARTLPDADQLVLQGFPRQRVQRRERLVHQQDLGLDCERTRQRDALPLPARELMRPALRQRPEPDEVELGLGPRQPLGPRRLALEAEGDIGDHLAPGQKPRILEDQRHRAPRAVGGMNRDLAGARLGEACDDPQQRRLADAGRPDDGQELAARDREVELAQHLGRLPVAGEGQGQAPDLDHRVLDDGLVDHAFQRSTHFWKATNRVSRKP